MGPLAGCLEDLDVAAQAFRGARERVSPEAPLQRVTGDGSDKMLWQYRTSTGSLCPYLT